jgi:hypothetical protein
MNSKQIMIEEATKARNTTAAELDRAFKIAAITGCPIGDGWLREQAATLAYYNELLINLGV